MATSSPTETDLALAFLIAAAAFGAAAAAAAAAGEKTKTAAVSASGQEPMVKLEIPLFKSKKVRSFSLENIRGREKIDGDDRHSRVVFSSVIVLCVFLLLLRCL